MKTEPRSLFYTSVVNPTKKIRHSSPLFKFSTKKEFIKPRQNPNLHANAPYKINSDTAIVHTVSNTTTLNPSKNTVEPLEELIGDDVFGQVASRLVGTHLPSSSSQRLRNELFSMEYLKTPSRDTSFCLERKKFEEQINRTYMQKFHEFCNKVRIQFLWLFQEKILASRELREIVADNWKKEFRQLHKQIKIAHKKPNNYQKNPNNGIYDISNLIYLISHETADWCKYNQQVVMEANINLRYRSNKSYSRTQDARAKLIFREAQVKLIRQLEKLSSAKNGNLTKLEMINRLFELETTLRTFDSEVKKMTKNSSRPPFNWDISDLTMV